jgi:hypothetical protein
MVGGPTGDVLFIATSYGKAIALDANIDIILCEYAPIRHNSWSGTSLMTTRTPAADPDRNNIYGAAPDGTVRSLQSPTDMCSGPPQSLCCRNVKKASQGVWRKSRLRSRIAYNSRQ